MVYCFLAEGFEELEAIATIDMLLRADIRVVTVAVGTAGNKSVTGSHGITVIADICEQEIVTDDSLEAVILPGGMPGTINLEGSTAVQSAIEYADKNDRYLCAICAAPLILGHKGKLEGKRATCFPGFEKELSGAADIGGYVVTDKNIITAKGAGVAVEFGLAIVSALRGNELSEQIKNAIQSR